MAVAGYAGTGITKPLKKSRAMNYDQTPTSQNGLHAIFFVVARGAGTPEIITFRPCFDFFNGLLLMSTRHLERESVLNHSPVHAGAVQWRVVPDGLMGGAHN
jgi:hypothetical protein